MFHWWFGLHGHRLTRGTVQKCINAAHKKWGGNYSEPMTFIIYLRQLKKKLQLADGYAKKSPSRHQGRYWENKKREQKTQEML